MEHNKQREQEREKIDAARYHVPYDLSAEDALKKITGEAVCHVDGVLGLKGSLGDIFKKGDDLRRGIFVAPDVPYLIDVKLIVDSDFDDDTVIEEVRNSVNYSVEEGAGIVEPSLSIEVAERMSKTEFIEKYGELRSCSIARDEYQ